MSIFQSVGSAMPLYDTVEYLDEVTDTATLHEDLSPEAAFGIASTTDFDSTASMQARIDTDAKFRRFVKPIILVLSGLLLGIVGAIVASQTSDPIQEVATASTFTVNKKIVSAPAPEEGSDALVQVDSRVQQLEQWFEEQPVPVKERVFLHQADKNLKVRKVGFSAPKAVASSYESDTQDPSIKGAQRKEGGRYLVGTPGNRIEWQGAWKVNAPAKNAAVAEKYLSDIEGRFGAETTEKLDTIKRPSGDYVKGTSQRAFGPKVN